jgi:CRP/FNR family nitrogen fixation transcriptional regulator
MQSRNPFADDYWPLVRPIDTRPDLSRELPACLEALATTNRWHRGQQIYSREDPVRCWYRIVGGMARKSTLLSDGRRRIVDFLLPGDFFGFSARPERYFDVEAVVETSVACYPRQRVEMLADSNVDVARRIREKAFESISRLQSRLLILGRVTAIEKVSAFLMELAERSSRSGSRVVILQMSRYDIADYLALSVETVSRSLTDLQHRRAIVLLGKHRVQITDPGALSHDEFGQIA